MAQFEERTILILGRTGNGKSTLANVLADPSVSTLFKESCFGASQTKCFQKATVDAGGIRLTIIDTVGIGDTQLSTQDVLYKIADACYQVRGGLHQIFFVTKGRFTPEEVAAYNLLRSVIFNSEVVRYTTIVRTGFAPFRKPDMCDTDLASMERQNAQLKDLLSSCNKVLHVNNPTEDEDSNFPATRIESQTKLLLHLQANCKNLYQPAELDQLNAKIGDFMTEQHTKNKLKI